MAVTPRAIQQIDRGAELIRTLPNGDQAWHCVISPPSQVERDIVYIYTRRGEVRRATAADYATLNGP